LVAIDGSYASGDARRPAWVVRGRYNREVTVRRILGVILLGIGGVGLFLCHHLWNGGPWFELLAWTALVWALMFLSWGLTLTWLETRIGCLLGASTGAASALIALVRGLRHPQWSSLTFPCVVAGGVGVLAGLTGFAVNHRRARRGPDDRPRQ
jgi:hypothetical protein